MERLDHFIARANAAYYATHDPFTDFTTAPEITQVFGQLLGAWAAICWQAMGAPASVWLAEAGPGRATLMEDAERGLARVAPAFLAARRLALIETSPRLRAIQSAALPHAIHLATLAELPPGPLILLANEFLDALPIRQFVRRAPGWTERFVADATFVERPAHFSGPDVAEASIIETCEPATDFATTLATRLATHGGAALLLDYGPEHTAPGDSLQALRAGQPTNPLAEPGSADITAHVDFQALAKAATEAGARAHGPLPQGKFLARLGLFQRTFQLARALPPRQATALQAAARRLAEPDQMGRLFKALAICHPALPPPPGFEEP